MAHALQVKLARSKRCVRNDNILRQCRVDHHSSKSTKARSCLRIGDATQELVEAEKQPLTGGCCGRDFPFTYDRGRPLSVVFGPLESSPGSGTGVKTGVS